MTDLTARLVKCLAFDKLACEDAAILRGDFHSLVKPGVIKGDTGFAMRAAKHEHARTASLVKALISCVEEFEKTYHAARLEQDCAICRSLTALEREIVRMELGE